MGRATTNSRANRLSLDVSTSSTAFQSCSRLYNDYDGIQHDYTKKQGLIWQQIFLPEYAPQEWQNRKKLWNAVEEVETAKDSR